MVQVVMTFIDEAPTDEKKLSVIETLRTVTEGKVKKPPFLQSYLLSTQDHAVNPPTP